MRSPRWRLEEARIEFILFLVLEWLHAKDIDDVSELCSCCPNLEVLSLPNNSIRSLREFSRLRSLRELHLRNNCISSFDELEFLSHLPSLVVLRLSENPVASDPQYRQIVFSMLPHLHTLDEMQVCVDDLQFSSPPRIASAAPAAGKKVVSEGSVASFFSPSEVPSVAGRSHGGEMSHFVKSPDMDSFSVVVENLENLSVAELKVIAQRALDLASLKKATGSEMLQSVSSSPPRPKISYPLEQRDNVPLPRPQPHAPSSDAWSYLPTSSSAACTLQSPNVSPFSSPSKPKRDRPVLCL